MNGARPRILIADDERDIRRTLCDWLDRGGYEAWPASDGAEALTLLQQRPFHVLVTDLVMPGLNGLALLDAAKSLDPGLQVVFLSGQATKADAIAALREGRSFDFLEKPLSDLSRLSRVIERAIALRPPLAEPSETPEPGPYGPVVQSVLTAIRQRFRETVTVGELAREFGYSAAHLSELVSRETGQPISAWLAATRIEHAQRLLATTGDSIQQIAIACGFPDPSYFARRFRTATGLTPQQWRARRES